MVSGWRKKTPYEDATDLSLVMERSIGEMKRNSNIHEDDLCSYDPITDAQCLMYLNSRKANSCKEPLFDLRAM